jgi:hypothetical protein
VRRDYVGLWTPAIGAEGGLLAYGHHGRPLLVFQSEQGPLLRLRGPGHDRRRRRPDRCRPGQGLLGRQLRRRQLVRPRPPLEERPASTASSRTGSSTRSSPSSTTTARAAGRSWSPGPASAPSTRPTSPSAGPTCSRWPSARAASTTPASSAGASAATPSTSTTRWTTWPTSRRPPRVAAGRLSLLLSAARASGRTPPGRSSRPGPSTACSSEKGIRHETDLWGHDVPHDWPSWRAQLAHHLPRFV